MAGIGGFGLFIYFVFAIPAYAMQYKLYYSKLLQDRYRVKFNRLLKGLAKDGVIAAEEDELILLQEQKNKRRKQELEAAKDELAEDK